ncbi:MAG: sugar ABC transporter substrate-binding protein [Anaerotruncus sp.]|nr:sugar ABC transporter substrate-binding protein [Anaerotruncus sp.]
MMKKTPITLLAFVLAFTMLIGCGTASPSTAGSSAAESTPAESSSAVDSAPAQTNGERQPLEIALLTKTLTNPYFVTNAEYFEKYVKERYPEDNVTVFDCNQDVSRELSITEDCITDGYDVIVLTPIDFEGTSTAIQKVVDAGIPCIVCEMTANIDQADLTVMADNFEAGYLSMQSLGEAMGGEGKMVVFQNSTNPVARERANGRDACLAEKFPKIEVVNTEDGAHTVEKCFEVMSNFLIADPDITGAWCFQDPNAVGVASAVKTAGITGQVKIVGIDGSEELCELIRNGEAVSSTAQMVATINRVMVENMYELLENGKLENPNLEIPCLVVDSKVADTEWAYWADDQPVKSIDIGQKIAAVGSAA